MVPRWYLPVVWKRGGLVGVIPKALYGEAPKGQSMIHRERLMTVRVEDQKGQPMIHRHRPKKNTERKASGG